MILIGQYDSPFVRRVGITLRRYGIEYEHRPWSVWGNAEEIARYNPLRRVPVLVLDDGVALVETFAIIDTLDERVGAERALVPSSGPARREALRVTALASGLADKAISLLYETLFRQQPSETWMQRCKLQIRDTLVLLESDRASRATPFYFGSDLSHADVALGCALRFVSEAHPSLLEPGSFPALSAHAARCETLPEFRAVLQPIVNNV